MKQDEQEETITGLSWAFTALVFFICGAVVIVTLCSGCACDGRVCPNDVRGCSNGFCNGNK